MNFCGDMSVWRLFVRGNIAMYCVFVRLEECFWWIDHSCVLIRRYSVVLCVFAICFKRRIAMNIMCIFLCGYILWVLRKESREKNEKKRKMNKDDKESYDND